MSRCAYFLPIALLVALIAIPPAKSAQDRQNEEALVDQVRTSIERGIRYLKQIEGGRGNWEVGAGAVIQRGGWTCLALLSLLTSGVKPDDKVIERGLTWIRDLAPQHTYVVGLQTMVLAEAGFAKDLPQIQRNVDWLIQARLIRGGKLVGWGYTGGGGNGDNSNAQYALLGLHSGKQAGAKIDIAIWKEIQEYYITTQSKERDGSGGWRYQPFNDGYPPSMTMTTAGMTGLYISGMELNENQQKLDPNTGVAAACNVYKQNVPIAKGIKWLTDDGKWAWRTKFHTFYNVYGIERVGRLSGRRFIGERDWYREGCKMIVPMQNDDGSWAIQGQGTDSWPVVSTSFALLFLSKGRTPVLITKMAYGRDDDDNKRGGGWNNKQFDLKNLIEFSKKELFKNHPLAWQIYDPRKLEIADDAAVREQVGELLQSPILYLNGHTAPQFTDGQKKVLKKYIEEGGFLVAEACCGREDFIKGFREVMLELFPNNPLRPLPPEHPIWRAHRPVPPDLFPKIEGIELGCKTVVILSGDPLAGFWEEAQFMPTPNEPATTRGNHAYRLAGNIIAYATGLELPKPRLTKVEVFAADDKPVPRSYLKVAQLRHEGNWEPAPNAMQNLMFHVRQNTKVDVALKKEVLSLTHPDVYSFKLLYMHGRNKFTVDPREVEILRANLESGGTLFADACCGKKEFDDAFREFVTKLFPQGKFERIPLDDYLFSAELNGKAIKTVMCRRDKAEYESVPPYLEGVKVDGRWAVIYSKFDIGCALEKHSSTDCKGHTHDSALEIGSAIVLYALKK